MTLIVLGDINVTGKLVLGTEYTVQTDEKTTLKMVVRDAEGYDTLVVLEDTETRCTVFVYKDTGEIFIDGANPLLNQLEFEAAVARCSAITSVMVEAYKQSLK